MLFSSSWTVAGLIPLYVSRHGVGTNQQTLPVLQGKSWGLYAAMIFTSSAPFWQPFNVTWVALEARTPAELTVTHAVYRGFSGYQS